MLPPVNWLHVIVAAAAGFAVSMIFYSLPVMRTHRKAQAVTKPRETKLKPVRKVFSQPSWHDS